MIILTQSIVSNHHHRTLEMSNASVWYQRGINVEKCSM